MATKTKITYTATFDGVTETIKSTREIGYAIAMRHTEATRAASVAAKSATCKSEGWAERMEAETPAAGQVVFYYAKNLKTAREHLIRLGAIYAEVHLVEVTAA